tara:strand:+ start:187 stop:507 length:321 start_codon:yes stop_codon:yes gene_type:complete
MAFVDPPFNYDYRKRHFFDVKQEKIEKNIKKTDTKKKMLVRTSLTPNERMLQGIKKDLNSYKKMLQEEQMINKKLHSEIHHLSSENRKYKLQLLNILRAMDDSLYN